VSRVELDHWITRARLRLERVEGAACAACRVAGFELRHSPERANPGPVAPKYGRGTEVPHPIDVRVGARIRVRRLLLGMNQETIADRLDLTFQPVQKYESGANRVSASRLSAIAEILGVPIACPAFRPAVRGPTSLRLLGTALLALGKAIRPPSSPRLMSELLTLLNPGYTETEERCGFQTLAYKLLHREQAAEAE